MTIKEWKENNKEKVALQGQRYYQKNKDRIKEYQKSRKAIVKERISEERKTNPDKYRDYELRKKYGITLDTYNQMLQDQGGVCKICKLPPNLDNKERLYVDHCHATKIVRGLIHNRCNTALGLFREKIEVLMGAIEYLKVSRG